MYKLLVILFLRRKKESKIHSIYNQEAFYLPEQGSVLGGQGVVVVVVVVVVVIAVVVNSLISETFRTKPK